MNNVFNTSIGNSFPSTVLYYWLLFDSETGDVYKRAKHGHTSSLAARRSGQRQLENLDGKMESTPDNVTMIRLLSVAVAKVHSQTMAITLDIKL